MKRRSTRAAGALLAVALGLATQGCGSASPTGRSAYILSDDGQHLRLDLIYEGTAGVFDSIDLGAVQNAPPPGAVLSDSFGHLIVSVNASFQGTQLAVRPFTQSCSMLTHTCSTLVPDGGSSIVDAINDGFVIPFYSGADTTHPKVAIIKDASTPTLESTAALPLGWVPGPIAVNRAGSIVYWVVGEPPQSSDAAPHYLLLAVDSHDARVLQQVSMGDRLPGAIVVAPNGDVYVAVTYERQGSKIPPVDPVPGKILEVFSPGLSPLGDVGVGSEPFNLTLNGTGSVIAVAYQDPTVGRVDMISLGTRQPLGFARLPISARVPTAVSSMSDGRFAVVLNRGGTFSIGYFDDSGTSRGWLNYSGNADSGVAG